MGDSHRNEAAVPADPIQRRRAAAEECVNAALRCLQEAQALLDRAGQALCSVRGMGAEWRKVGTRYDQVHATWYAVEQKAATLRAQGWLLLDHDPDAGQTPGGRS